ncbi:hypothetical protein NLI96_g11480 [Meripilus lineatus]|uniref:Ribonuclease H1 N-terminal domain-containing protein n=1 Tax=Meripilus lineatus TaxID=2056292 RepID=A0AAD5UT52_9APHY|nr:hypothetical protein NLI96_g11480 [Physisporinus lineatus]
MDSCSDSAQTILTQVEACVHFSNVLLGHKIFYAVLNGRSGTSTIYLTWQDTYDDIFDTDYSRNKSFLTFLQALQFLLTKGGDTFAAQEQQILANRVFLDEFERMGIRDDNGEAEVPSPETSRRLSIISESSITNSNISAGQKHGSHRKTNRPGTNAIILSPQRSTQALRARARPIAGASSPQTAQNHIQN